MFSDNQVIIIYWLIKRIRNFFWGTHFFENMLLLSVSANSLQAPSLVDLVKRCFEIFLIDHGASDIANKNIAGKYQNVLVSVSFTLY